MNRAKTLQASKFHMISQKGGKNVAAEREGKKGGGGYAKVTT